MSCCPDNSWGSLKPDSEYKEQGTVTALGDLQVYTVGKSEKCVIWNYHIYGFTDGRQRQLADIIASKGMKQFST